MIDILIQEPDMLVIAHDVEEFGHLVRVSVDESTGLVEALDRDGTSHNLGRLTPSMRALIADIKVTKIAALDGMEAMLPYACELERA